MHDISTLGRHPVFAPCRPRGGVGERIRQGQPPRGRGGRPRRTGGGGAGAAEPRLIGRQRMPVPYVSGGAVTDSGRGRGSACPAPGAPGAEALAGGRACVAGGACATAGRGPADGGWCAGGESPGRAVARVAGAVGAASALGPDAVRIGPVRLAVLCFLIRMRSSCGGMRVRGASGYCTSPPVGGSDVLLTSSILKYREFRGLRQGIGGRIYARNTWAVAGARAAGSRGCRGPSRSRDGSRTLTPGAQAARRASAGVPVDRSAGRSGRQVELLVGAAGAGPDLQPGAVGRRLVGDVEALAGHGVHQGVA